MLFKHVLDDSILDSKRCLIVEGVIIRATRGRKTKKRIFSIKSDIIDVEILKSDINVGINSANEAASSGVTDGDIPIQRVR